MKANPDKCHLLVTTNKTVSANIENHKIKNGSEEMLLGVKIDSKLSFENHISSLCKKASQKLHALARVVKYMNLEKLKCLMKAFVTSQFSYCPLVWMFHSRKMNNRINRIHERALRLVYQDHVSTFDELLDKDNSVTIHQKNLQVLATEIFKVKNGLSPEIMKQVFELREAPYNFRSESSLFKRENVKTTNYGIQSIRYLGPKIWDLLPNNIKNSSSLVNFKKKIKFWKPTQCPCKLCKKYIARVGFI